MHDGYRQYEGYGQVYRSSQRVPHLHFGTHAVGMDKSAREIRSSSPNKALPWRPK